MTERTNKKIDISHTFNMTAFLSALTKPMDKRFWSFLPETHRTPIHNNDEIINRLCLM